MKIKIILDKGIKDLVAFRERSSPWRFYESFSYKGCHVHDIPHRNRKPIVGFLLKLQKV
jgi:hypothetical protein